jgi:hypothetical protein
LWALCFFFLSFVLVCMCVCVWSCRRGGHEQQKSEKRDEEKKQHEEQLEKVSLLQSSPCKPTMVIEVCCHRHEISTTIMICYFHWDFL